MNHRAIVKSRPEELRERTKQFALKVIQLVRSLPRTDEARLMGRQLLKSATSVAANYRAVCRARSKPEFIAKVGIVVEEADESVFWLEMLRDSRTAPESAVIPLLKEANEVVAIFAASQRTARGSMAKSPDRSMNQ